MDSFNTNRSYMNVSLPSTLASCKDSEEIKHDKKLLHGLIKEEQNKILVEKMVQENIT